MCAGGGNSGGSTLTQPTRRTATVSRGSTYKLSDDRFYSRAANLVIRGKSQVWGLGPEVTLREETRMLMGPA